MKNRDPDEIYLGLSDNQWNYIVTRFIWFSFGLLSTALLSLFYGTCA